MTLDEFAGRDGERDMNSWPALGGVATASGCDPTCFQSGKAIVVRMPYISARFGHEPQATGSARQGHAANPAARECREHDEHLREDGFVGRYGGNEDARS
jgi:hypothetical protein